MKGGRVCSFGIFSGELVFCPLEVLRIAWPFGDWPGTLDTSCLFEDKSCWTVSLEAQGQTVRTLFQKVKIIESFPQTSHLCPNSASANSVRLPDGSWQPIVARRSLARAEALQPAPQLTPGNRGQHFAWHASSVMNWREWKGREWNEEKKENRKKC